MDNSKVVYPNEPLRVVMDKYKIRVIDNPDEFRREAIPMDFRYWGKRLEVRMWERSIFCRFDGIGAHDFYGKKLLLSRFPNWEGWLLFSLLTQAKEAHYCKGQATIGMKGWLESCGGSFGNSKNRHEFKYACRAMDDLERLFGPTILKEVQEVIDACSWETDDL